MGFWFKYFLFKSYCMSFYYLSLTTNAKMNKINRLKVCYNNCIRRLFNLPFRASISRACVENGVPTFQEVRRKCIVSLYQRLKRSSNSIIYSLMHNVFHSSYLYGAWRPLAFVWVTFFLTALFLVKSDVFMYGARRPLAFV